MEYQPTWELPLEGENPKGTKDELLLEVENLCRAVIAGHCKNRRSFLGVGSVVLVGSREYKVRHFPILWPKPPFRGTRPYQAYSSETIDAI
jgi:hypothetical protein